MPTKNLIDSKPSCCNQEPVCLVSYWWNYFSFALLLQNRQRQPGCADVLRCLRASCFRSRLNTFATLFSWQWIQIFFKQAAWHYPHPKKSLGYCLLNMALNEPFSHLWLTQPVLNGLISLIQAMFAKSFFFSTETINCNSKWQPTLACWCQFSQPPVFFFFLLGFIWFFSSSFPPRLTWAYVFGDSRSHPSLLQASAWRAQPPPLIRAAGAAARVLPRTWRGWATRQTNPWTTTPRECGAPILSRASRRPWPSIPHVDAGRSSSLTRERCMVSADVYLFGLKATKGRFYFILLFIAF